MEKLIPPVRDVSICYESVCFLPISQLFCIQSNISLVTPHRQKTAESHIEKHLRLSLQHLVDELHTDANVHYHMATSDKLAKTIYTKAEQLKATLIVLSAEALPREPVCHLHPQG